MEKSAGAVIFRRENNENYYLLLYYPSLTHRSEKDYWDLPKGHIEVGEDEIQTVRREVTEETGLKNIRIIGGFEETIKYFFKYNGKTISKTVVFYLAETKTKEVNISGEHMAFKWLAFREALEHLAHKNAKNILKKADNFLNTKNNH